uniref:Fructose-bisphosphate aldolase n=1 Tax=Eufriesea mexicana TaxID=516756 RepID=A0A310S443_9HYME
MGAFFTYNLERIIGNGHFIPLNAFINDNAFTIAKKAHILTEDSSQEENNKFYTLAEVIEFLDSNYAYTIDTIVTQSWHHGKGRHTFYSNNPFTYRETEKIAFSYPAKILPPSAQSIAKSIIISTDLKVELNCKDMPSYKSITIYYKYNVISVIDSYVVGYGTKEDFNPAKELTSSIEINLNDLIFSKSILSIDKKKHSEGDKIGNHSSGYTYAYYARSTYLLYLATQDVIVTLSALINEGKIENAVKTLNSTRINFKEKNHRGNAVELPKEGYRGSEILTVAKSFFKLNGNKFANKSSIETSSLIFKEYGITYLPSGNHYVYIPEIEAGSYMLNNDASSLEILCNEMVHGQSVDSRKKALDACFSSVTFDGPHVDFYENIIVTMEVVTSAKELNASVEAEANVIGGQEDGVIGSCEIARDEYCPALAALGNDFLADGINNIHGKYPKN